MEEFRRHLPVLKAVSVVPQQRRFTRLEVGERDGFQPRAARRMWYASGHDGDLDVVINNAEGRRRFIATTAHGAPHRVKLGRRARTHRVWVPGD